MLCLLVYGCLERNSTGILVPPDSVCRQYTARRPLRSASSSNLVVPSTRRASIGDRAFAVADSKKWNSLPPALRPPPNRSFLKKNLSRFFVGSHFVCDNVNTDNVKRPSNSFYRIVALNKLSYLH